MDPVDGPILASLLGESPLTGPLLRASLTSLQPPPSNSLVPCLLLPGSCFSP